MQGLWAVSYALLWLSLVLMALLLLSMLRQLGNIYLALERQDAGVLPGVDAGLPVGDSTPDVSLWGANGEPRRLIDYRGRPLLLVFSFPDCGPCKQLIPELNVFRQSDATKNMAIVVITQCDPAEHKKLAAAYADGIALLRQESRRAITAFGVPATPFAFVMDAHGIIRAKRIVHRRDHLYELTARAREGGEIGGHPFSEAVVGT